MDRRNQVTARPGARCRRGFIVGALLLGGFVVAASAQAPPPAGTARFVGRYWSQSRPALNYRYGCDTGWHSFSFNALGFFVYDRTVVGHWWLDHANNVGVMTNSGERLVLMFDGSGTLVQWRRDEKSEKSPFGQEYRTYKECDAGVVVQ